MQDIRLQLAFREVLIRDNVWTGKHVRYYQGGGDGCGNYVCRVDENGNLILRGQKGLYRIRRTDNMIFYDFVNNTVAAQIVFQCSLISEKIWNVNEVFQLIVQWGGPTRVNSMKDKEEEKEIERRVGRPRTRESYILKQMGVRHDKVKAVLLNFYQRILVQKYI